MWHQLAPVLASGCAERRRYLEDNAGAVDVELTPADLARIDRVMPRGAAAGERYSPMGMALAER